MITIILYCKIEGIFGKIAWNCYKLAFSPVYSIQISIFKMFVFQIRENFNQSNLVISGHYLSFQVLCQFLFRQKVVRLLHVFTYTVWFSSDSQHDMFSRTCCTAIGLPSISTNYQLKTSPGMFGNGMNK